MLEWAKPERCVLAIETGNRRAPLLNALRLCSTSRQRLLPTQPGRIATRRLPAPVDVAATTSRSPWLAFPGDTCGDGPMPGLLQFEAYRLLERRTFPQPIRNQ